MKHVRSLLLVIFALCGANADRVGITVQYFDNSDCSGAALAGAYGMSPGGNPPYATGCIHPTSDPVGFIGSCPALNTTDMKYWRTGGGGSLVRDGLDWQIMDRDCTTSASWSATTNRNWDVPVCKSCNTIFGQGCAGAASHVKFSCGDHTTSGNPCFPSSSRATLANGKSVRLDALKEGDKIVAAAADGSVTTGTVSLLSIAKPGAEATFVNLTTSAGKSITLTAGHHLPVGPTCCESLKKAKDVTVGETVWAEAADAASRTTVASIAHVTARGLHSPVLTNGGFPIIDGIVTSFDSIDKVTLAKHGLASLLTMCKATGTCETFRDLFLGDGSEFAPSA